MVSDGDRLRFRAGKLKTPIGVNSIIFPAPYDSTSPGNKEPIAFSMVRQGASFVPGLRSSPFKARNRESSIEMGMEVDLGGTSTGGGNEGIKVGATLVLMHPLAAIISRIIDNKLMQFVRFSLSKTASIM